LEEEDDKISGALDELASTIVDGVVEELRVS
jgi:hypothetical protein